MVGTGMGTFQRLVMPQKQNIFSNELYTVAKSFQIWSFYFYVHKLLKRPQFCFAQAYRTVLVPGTVHVATFSNSRAPSRTMHNDACSISIRTAVEVCGGGAA